MLGPEEAHLNLGNISSSHFAGSGQEDQMVASSMMFKLWTAFRHASFVESERCGAAMYFNPRVSRLIEGNLKKAYEMGKTYYKAVWWGEEEDGV
jgi:hypothetical protein